MRRGAATFGALAAAVVFAASCSGGDDDAATDTATDITTDSAASPETSAASTTVPDTEPASASTASTTDAPTTSAAPTTVLATVPDDGVPGIDSDDPFCQAWSEFAGSFQALSLAASFGDPAAAARIEVAAAGAVTAAVDTLDEELPPEVEEERSAFLEGLIGPFSRRADRAAAELEAAGASPAQIEALGDAWLASLVETGIDDPAITVAVGVELAGPLDRAVVVFAANVPPIPADPSLITDAAAPATLAYIAENCPDQGILSGNDVIDG